MMGRHAKQNELWSEAVNLAGRIPDDHPLRKLQAVLSLDFVREEVAACYGKNGNVSVDPVIILKMMLLLFWDNVRSERELMKIIPLRIDYLWFLGFGLEDEVPDHSVLSKARRRWGLEVFERLFSQSVQQCLDAGLIDGGKLYADSSLVRADASLNSVVKLTLAKLEEPESFPSEPADHPTPAPPSSPPAPRTANSSCRVTTDPDCALVRHRHGKALPSYKNHRALDAQAGVITATITTDGVGDDGAELVHLVEAHQQKIGRRPRAVAADCKYGTTENFIALGQRGIRTHMGDLRRRLRNHHLQDIYPTESFRYDAANDSYQCPAGETLRYHHFHHQRGYREYRAKARVCRDCPLAAHCTRSKAGRSINRYPAQEVLDKGRRQSAGPAARRDRQRRQWLQERNFGEATTMHGYKRARWRGLWKQTLQDNLIAALQNFKILVRQGLKSLFHAPSRLWCISAKLSRLTPRHCRAANPGSLSS